MSNTIRWGIISTGAIAQAFAEGLSVLPDAKLVAVGSRSQASADKFGDQFGVPNRHASYEALVNDPEVDVVYIGTPHNFHKDNTLLALNAGKHVLCEKAFALNAEEARQMIETARTKNLFLMEAMWTRFIPAVVKIRELIHDGTIGDVRMMQANFGFRAEFDPQSRLFNPELAGGALLDVGIYPVAFASMIFGKQPDEMSSYAHLGETGVDEAFGGVFRYDDGRLALVAGSLRLDTAREALIYGTEGMIRVHYPFWQPHEFTLTQSGKSPQLFELPIESTGLNYEAAEVMRCIREGKTESAIMSLDESLALMETMDAMRASWGLRYPMEA